LTDREDLHSFPTRRSSDLIEKYHDGQLEWTGFVIPNGFRRLLIAGKKYIQVDAADGLSTLQSIPFLNTDGQTYGTQDLVYNDGLDRKSTRLNSSHVKISYA